MTNREKFISSYARRLKTHWAANPKPYAEPMPASFTEKAENNLRLILSFEYDPGIVVRMTMKEYGLEPTYAALKDFLTI